jgi:hypothetical protein
MGQSVTLSVTGGLSPPGGYPTFNVIGFGIVAWQGLALPYDLSLLLPGGPSCLLYVQVDFLQFTLGAPITVAVPAFPSLIGTHVYFQTIQTGSNGIPASGSDALDVVIGS